MVRGVAGRVGDLEALDGLAALEHVQALLGHRDHQRPRARPCARRRVSWRSPSASTGRRCAARRARARRPAGRGSGGTARPSRRRGRGGCGSAAARAGCGPRGPPAGRRGSSWGRDRRSPRPPRRQQITRSRPRCMTSIARLTAANHHTILAMAQPDHRLPERDRPWVMRTYAGHSSARESNELYRKNLAKGQTGLSIAFDLPTQTGYDPDHELARGEVGKVGVSIAHKGDMHALLDGIPLDEMNTSMTINATAAWLLALYMTVAEENGVERARAPGHDPERHHQGVPGARDLRLPARALDAADRGHDRVHRRRGPEVEPDQHLQLPPAGGRGHAGAGDRLRALDRPGGARPRAPARARGDLPARLRAHLVLRQRRHPLRRGARQAARDGPALGADRPRALRRRGPALPAPALRRAGQLARPDRGAAGEQHHPHRARGARGDDGPRRPRPRAAAAGLERGARPAAAVGPAVVAADPADPRLRDGPARLPRHLRGLEGDGRARRRAGDGRPRGDGDRRRAGRRRGRGAVHEDRSWSSPTASACAASRPASSR